MTVLAGVSLGTELKRYSKGVMPRLAIITITLLPLLYGAMYLWVYWNPFGEVNKLPVAIVNQDQGATANGQDLNAGDQVLDTMMKTDQLHLIPTSAVDAEDGLEHGRYYFTITIPQDFSSSIASATSKDPHKAQVKFAFNDANSYLAGVIGNTAATQVTAALNEQIGGRSVDQVLVGLQTAGEGLEQAADGAGQLSDGASQLKDGTSQLVDGTGRADDGAQQLAEGAHRLADNMGTAQEGAEQLAAGNAQLADGISTATGPLKPLLEQIHGFGLTGDDAAELGRLSGQLSTLLAAVGQAGTQQSQAAQAVQQTIAALRATGDPNLRTLADGLKPVLTFLTSQGIDPALQAKAESYSKQADTLSDQLTDPKSSMRSMLDAVNSGELAGKVDELNDGAQQLKDGSAQLADGLTQLNDGSQQLAEGADELASGLPQIDEGARQLDDGAARLGDGADQLATGLADGVKQLPDFGGDDQRQKAAGNLSNPVALKTFTHNASPNFGTGFAPFFLPLALYIGAMIIWMLLKPLQPRPLVGGLGGLRTVLASYWPAFLVAAAQVAVMFVVSHFFIGLDPRHALGMLAFMVLVSATFLALIQMLNVVLGVAVGRVVTLAVLMVMIVASGGMYPVETTAKPAQLIHPYDPMTYAVNGMRQMIAGGVDGRLTTAIIVLVCVLAGSMAISALAARRNRQYTMVQLFPPIQV